MAEIEIRLLGPPVVRVDNREVVLPGRKAAALLYYLAAHCGRPLSRPHLIALLWEDHSEQEGRNNLSTTLSRLRAVLPGADELPIARVGDALSWQASRGVHVDLEIFEQLVHGGGSPLDRLEEAARLHRGAFLEGFEVRDSGPFEEWLQREREHWQQRVLAAHEALIDTLRHHHPAEAIAAAQRALKVAPLHESLHRTLMELYYRRGDRASALAQFAACERVLRDEIDIAPSVETVALRNAILAGEPAGAPEAYRRQNRPAPPDPAPAVRQRAQHRLIGRSEELAYLRAQFDVTPWRGRLLAVEGEVGIGKTRLVEELLDSLRLAQRRWTILVGHSYQDAQGMPHHPLIEALRSQLPAIGLDSLDISDVWLSEVSRLLPELTVARSPASAAMRLDPQQERQRLFEGVARLLAALPAPRLLVLEDLHWADAETLHLLTYLVRHEGLPQTMFLATVRSEDATEPLQQTLAGLEYGGRLDRLTLSPLSATATTELVREVARATPVDFANLVFQESEGNPLFVVELARARLETVDAPGGPSREGVAEPQIPPTVQAVIRGRLSRLDAPSRDFVSAVAVFRRALDFDEVRSVAGQDEGAALAASEALVGAQILREVPIPLAAGMVVHRYAFAHEQFRRVVYAGLSDARRRVLHRHALELLADAGDDQAEEMAYHACRGELWSGGLDWSERAAADAMALFACAPAVHLYEQALTCAGQLRPTPELRRRVIDLRLRLAEAGFYVQPSRLSEWLAPAQADAAALGDVGRQAQVGLAQASAVYIRGHFTTALPHLERLQAMAESTCDQGLRARTANVLGRLLVIRGELRRGGAALEHALAATEAANGQEPIWPATAIERLVSIGLLASAQAFLGEFAAAEQTMARCRSLVAASGDPSARAAAAFYDALVAQTHGEWARATTLANEAIAQARSAANLIYEYVTHVYLGPALARQGRVAEGLAVQRAALELADRAQIQVILGRAHAWLGEILLLDGKPEEAYDAARRGEVLSDEHGYLLEAAMCTRVRGEAAMAMGAWAEAEEALASASSALSELEAWPEWARTQLALGHLASALGEHESSRCHFERASERFAAMGMSPAALIPSSRPT